MKFNCTIQFSKVCNTDQPYMIVAMYTEKYTALAERLNLSLMQSKLDYCIFKVPTVHKSISPNGSDEPAYCKPNFILYTQEIFNKSILYLDCDTVIKEDPVLIQQIAKGDCDFAIYNWLACRDNSAYVPIIENGMPTKIWGYSHSINYASESQLICSGAVQYWKNSLGGKLLLKDWLEAIIKFSASQDDHCLDYAFNNLSEKASIKYKWLPKGYARYAWWIFDRPVIDHPQIPFSGTYFKEIVTSNGKERCYVNKLSPTYLKNKKIINVDTGEIFISEDNLLKAIGISKDIWI